MTENEQTALDAMTYKQLRKAQELCQAQIPLAYKQRNTKALTQLQEWDACYAEAINKVSFGTS